MGKGISTVVSNHDRVALTYARFAEECKRLRMQPSEYSHRQGIFCLSVAHNTYHHLYLQPYRTNDSVADAVIWRAYLNIFTAFTPAKQANNWRLPNGSNQSGNRLEMTALIDDMPAMMPFMASWMVARDRQSLAHLLPSALRLSNAALGGAGMPMTTADCLKASYLWVELKAAKAPTQPQQADCLKASYLWVESAERFYDDCEKRRGRRLYRGGATVPAKSRAG